MKTKFTLVAMSVVMGLALYIVRPKDSHQAQNAPAALTTGIPAVASATPEPQEPSASIELPAEPLEAQVPVIQSSVIPEPPKAMKPIAVKPASPQRVGRRKPEPVAPVARMALAYVGEDEEAEEIWNDAINDPTIPPNERKDLIEDLNEDGFPDPHHVTVDDLPLILSRLALIEEMAPDAMDEVNADAFAEAYKDLANMVDRLAQQ